MVARAPAGRYHERPGRGIAEGVRPRYRKAPEEVVVRNRTWIFVLAAVVIAAVVLPALAEEAPDGKALYEKKCALCHGKDGVAKPMAKGSANLNDPEYQKKATDEEIDKITLEGKGKMPGYKDKMSMEEIKAVTAHVRTLK